MARIAHLSITVAILLVAASAGLSFFFGVWGGADDIMWSFIFSHDEPSDVAEGAASRESGFTEVSEKPTGRKRGSKRDVATIHHDPSIVVIKEQHASAEIINADSVVASSGSSFLEEAPLTTATASGETKPDCGCCGDKKDEPHPHVTRVRYDYSPLSDTAAEVAINSSQSYSYFTESDLRNIILSRNRNKNKNTLTMNKNSESENKQSNPRQPLTTEYAANTFAATSNTVFIGDFAFRTPMVSPVDVEVYPSSSTASFPLRTSDVRVPLTPQTPQNPAPPAVVVIRKVYRREPTVVLNDVPMITADQRRAVLDIVDLPKNEKLDPATNTIRITVHTVSAAHRFVPFSAFVLKHAQELRLDDFIHYLPFGLEGRSDDEERDEGIVVDANNKDADESKDSSSSTRVRSAGSTANSHFSFSNNKKINESKLSASGSFALFMGAVDLFNNGSLWFDIDTIPMPSTPLDVSFLLRPADNENGNKDAGHKVGAGARSSHHPHSHPHPHAARDGEGDPFAAHQIEQVSAARRKIIPQFDFLGQYEDNDFVLERDFLFEEGFEGEEGPSSITDSRKEEEQEEGKREASSSFPPLPPVRGTRGWRNFVSSYAPPLSRYIETGTNADSINIKSHLFKNKKKSSTHAKNSNNTKKGNNNNNNKNNNNNNNDYYYPHSSLHSSLHTRRGVRGAHAEEESYDWALREASRSRGGGGNRGGGGGRGRERGNFRMMGSGRHPAADDGVTAAASSPSSPSSFSYMHGTAPVPFPNAPTLINMSEFYSIPFAFKTLPSDLFVKIEQQYDEQRQQRQDQKLGRQEGSVANREGKKEGKSAAGLASGGRDENCGEDIVSSSSSSSSVTPSRPTTSSSSPFFPQHSSHTLSPLLTSLIPRDLRESLSHPCMVRILEGDLLRRERRKLAARIRYLFFSSSSDQLSSRSSTTSIADEVPARTTPPPATPSSSSSSYYYSTSSSTPPVTTPPTTAPFPNLIREDQSTMFFVGGGAGRSDFNLILRSVAHQQKGEGEENEGGEGVGAVGLVSQRLEHSLSARLAETENIMSETIKKRKVEKKEHAYDANESENENNNTNAIDDEDHHHESRSSSSSDVLLINNKLNALKQKLTVSQRAIDLCFSSSPSSSSPSASFSSNLSSSSSQSHFVFRLRLNNTNHRTSNNNNDGTGKGEKGRESGRGKGEEDEKEDEQLGLAPSAAAANGDSAGLAPDIVVVDLQCLEHMLRPATVAVGAPIKNGRNKNPHEQHQQQLLSTAHEKEQAIKTTTAATAEEKKEEHDGELFQMSMVIREVIPTYIMHWSVGRRRREYIVSELGDHGIGTQKEAETEEGEAKEEIKAFPPSTSVSKTAPKTVPTSSSSVRKHPRLALYPDDKVLADLVPRDSPSSSSSVHTSRKDDREGSNIKKEEGENEKESGEQRGGANGPQHAHAHPHDAESLASFGGFIESFDGAQITPDVSRCFFTQLRPEYLHFMSMHDPHEFLLRKQRYDEARRYGLSHEDVLRWDAAALRRQGKDSAITRKKTLISPSSSSSSSTCIDHASVSPPSPSPPSPSPFSSPFSSSLFSEPSSKKTKKKSKKGTPRLIGLGGGALKGKGPHRKTTPHRVVGEKSVVEESTGSTYSRFQFSRPDRGVEAVHKWDDGSSDEEDNIIHQNVEEETHHDNINNNRVNKGVEKGQDQHHQHHGDEDEGAYDEDSIHHNILMRDEALPAASNKNEDDYDDDDDDLHQQHDGQQLSAFFASTSTSSSAYAHPLLDPLSVFYRTSANDTSLIVVGRDPCEKVEGTRIVGFEEDELFEKYICSTEEERERKREGEGEENRFINTRPHLHPQDGSAVGKKRNNYREEQHHDERRGAEVDNDNEELSCVNFYLLLNGAASAAAPPPNVNNNNISERNERNNATIDDEKKEDEMMMIDAVTKSSSYCEHRKKSLATTYDKVFTFPYPQDKDGGDREGYHCKENQKQKKKNKKKSKNNTKSTKMSSSHSSRSSFLPVSYVNSAPPSHAYNPAFLYWSLMRNQPNILPSVGYTPEERRVEEARKKFLTNARDITRDSTARSEEGEKNKRGHGQEKRDKEKEEEGGEKDRRFMMMGRGPRGRGSERETRREPMDGPPRSMGGGIGRIRRRERKRAVAAADRRGASSHSPSSSFADSNNNNNYPSLLSESLAGQSPDGFASAELLTSLLSEPLYPPSYSSYSYSSVASSSAAFFKSPPLPPIRARTMSGSGKFRACDEHEDMLPEYKMDGGAADGNHVFCDDDNYDDPLIPPIATVTGGKTLHAALAENILEKGPTRLSEFSLTMKNIVGWYDFVRRALWFDEKEKLFFRRVEEERMASWTEKSNRRRRRRNAVSEGKGNAKAAAAAAASATSDFENNTTTPSSLSSSQYITISSSDQSEKENARRLASLIARAASSFSATSPSFSFSSSSASAAAPLSSATYMNREDDEKSAVTINRYRTRYAVFIEDDAVLRVGFPKRLSGIVHYLLSGQQSTATPPNDQRREWNGKKEGEWVEKEENENEAAERQKERSQKKSEQQQRNEENIGGRSGGSRRQSVFDSDKSKVRSPPQEAEHNRNFNQGECTRATAPKYTVSDQQQQQQQQQQRSPARAAPLLSMLTRRRIPDHGYFSPIFAGDYDNVASSFSSFASHPRPNHTLFSSSLSSSPPSRTFSSSSQPSPLPPRTCDFLMRRPSISEYDKLYLKSALVGAWERMIMSSTTFGARNSDDDDPVVESPRQHGEQHHKENGEKEEELSNASPILQRVGRDFESTLWNLLIYAVNEDILGIPTGRSRRGTASSSCPAAKQSNNTSTSDHTDRDNSSSSSLSSRIFKNFSVPSVDEVSDSLMWYVFGNRNYCEFARKVLDLHHDYHSTTNNKMNNNNNNGNNKKNMGSGNRRYHLQGEVSSDAQRRGVRGVKNTNNDNTRSRLHEPKMGKKSRGGSDRSISSSSSTAAILSPQWGERPWDLLVLSSYRENGALQASSYSSHSSSDRSDANAIAHNSQRGLLSARKVIPHVFAKGLPMGTAAYAVSVRGALELLRALPTAMPVDEHLAITALYPDPSRSAPPSMGPNGNGYSMRRKISKNAVRKKPVADQGPFQVFTVNPHLAYEGTGAGAGGSGAPCLSLLVGVRPSCQTRQFHPAFDEDEKNEEKVAAEVGKKKEPEGKALKSHAFKSENNSETLQKKKEKKMRQKRHTNLEIDEMWSFERNRYVVLTYDRRLVHTSKREELEKDILLQRDEDRENKKESSSLSSSSLWSSGLWRSSSSTTITATTMGCDCDALTDAEDTLLPPAPPRRADACRDTVPLPMRQKYSRSNSTLVEIVKVDDDKADRLMLKALGDDTQFIISTSATTFTCTEPSVSSCSPLHDNMFPQQQHIQKGKSSGVNTSSLLGLKRHSDPSPIIAPVAKNDGEDGDCSCCSCCVRRHTRANALKAGTDDGAASRCIHKGFCSHVQRNPYDAQAEKFFIFEPYSSASQSSKRGST